MIRTVSDYFVDAAKGNLHLTAKAADAMDKATADSDIKEDIDGQPRGTKPDLGADEFLE